MRQTCLMASLLVWASLITCAAAAPRVGKTPVAVALERLETWLADGPHAAGWSEYLQLDALRTEMRRSDAPNLAVLETTLARLAANKQGLELLPFVELRTALEGWLARESLPQAEHLKAVTDSLERRSLLRPADEDRASPLKLVAEQRQAEVDKPVQQEFHNRLTALRVMLAVYDHAPSPWLADEINATLDWLSHTGRAEPLVAAVRDYYGHPNVWIDVAESSLAGGVDGAVERTVAVEDSILGTVVRGHGLTKATKKLTLAPHAERAVLTLHVSGSVDTSTVGHSGPARIHGHARTTFRAEKQFWLDENGIKAWPTVCTAETNTLSSHVTSRSRGMRGRIVRRVAQRQVSDQQAEADRIAARHAEDQIREMVDREASDLVSQIERSAIAPLLAMSKSSAASIRFRFCSEKGLLRIGVVMGPLGAPPGEPKLPLASGVAIRWHSTVGERLMRHRWAKMLMDSMQPTNRLTAGLSTILPASVVQTASTWSRQLVQPTAGPTTQSEIPQPQTIPLLSEEKLEEAVEDWLNRLLDPGITPSGIALRDGKLGTLSLTGSDWMSVAWGSSAPPARLAQQRGGTIE